MGRGYSPVLPFARTSPTERGRQYPTCTRHQSIDTVDTADTADTARHPRHSTLDTLDTSTTSEHPRCQDRRRHSLDTLDTSTPVSTDTPSTPPRHSVDTVDTVDTSTHQGSTLLVMVGSYPRHKRATIPRQNPCATDHIPMPLSPKHHCG